MKGSHKKNDLYNVILRIFIVVFCCGYFFSCSRDVKVDSVLTHFDEIDYCISMNQTQTALKLLKKIDKRSNPVNIQLGIYKRYIELGENKLAEKLIKRCYKNHSDDKKVVAIYSHQLLKNKKNKQALTVSKKLSGSSYASIYAEALLKTEFSFFGKESVNIDFESKDFLNIYYDAFLGTNENYWLRNCAVINLLNDKSDSALIYVPNDFGGSRDAYFWGLIYYDNKKYVEALQSFKKAKELVEFEIEDSFYKDKKSDLVSLLIQIRGMISDCYVNLSEQKLAEKERVDFLDFLTQITDENGKLENFSEVDEKLYDQVLSVIYLNSALYALSNSNYKEACKLLQFEVEQWPDFVPGLICYGNYALETSNFTLNDPMTLELRELGIKSMDMELFDEIVKIPVEDAINRMKQSYNRFKNYNLFVAMLELEDKVNPLSEKAAYAKIYQTLERNLLASNSYPLEVLDYSISRLIRLNYVEEAEELFHKVLIQQYSFDKNNSFYDECFRFIHQLKTWEIEYLAWFAAYRKKADIATYLYEFIVFNEYLKSQKQVLEIASDVSDIAIMNLAMIYSSTNQKEKSLKLYGHVSNYSKTVRLKAEALYRIGVIYLERNEVENAVRSLKYAVYLNPSHLNARLLLEQN